MLAYEIHRYHPDLRERASYPDSLIETVPAAKVVGRLAVLSGRDPALIVKLIKTAGRPSGSGKFYLSANRRERDAHGLPHKGVHVERVDV